MNKAVINTNDNSSSQVLNRNRDFEEQYLCLRRRENRIYTDAVLFNLPDISKEHPHYKEWLVRKNSFQKLLGYLKRKKNSLKILEVGCGNGWLSNQLALQLNCQVTGIDINSAELDQASRVFKQNTECTFLYGDLNSGILNQERFDIIVFAASLQYFSSAKDVLTTALRFLKAGGEIHILDTHFYKELELEEARQRSNSHFTSLGSAGMSSMYFHHSLNDLKDFQAVILYDPFLFRNRFFRNKAPFYWVSIKKD